MLIISSVLSAQSLRDSSVAPGPSCGAETDVALPLFQFTLLWKHHFSHNWPTLDGTGSSLDFLRVYVFPALSMVTSVLHRLGENVRFI